MENIAELEREVSGMISRSDLLQLIDLRDGPCISLYMPTHRAGRDKREDGIRHKNLVKEAHERLGEYGISGDIAERLLKPVVDLPQQSDLWEHRLEGLAAFSTQDFFRTFALPLEFAEIVLVDDHFHISPLTPLLHECHRFYILTLSKDSADLYEVTHNSLSECELDVLAPVVLDGAEPTLQFHSQRAPSQGKGNIGETMYHGHGNPDDREKADVENFFKRQVEPEVTAVLQEEDAPLVLACVDYLAPIYREANSYSKLLDGHVSGNPDGFSEDTLRACAWQLLEPIISNMEEVARSKLSELQGSGQTVDKPKLVLEAARNGRVESLFVPRSLAIRSARPPANGESTAGIVETMELSVEHTLRNGGQVFAVNQVPGGVILAAVLRF
jgi:hypothetical protein